MGEDWTAYDSNSSDIPEERVQQMIKDGGIQVPEEQQLPKDDGDVEEVAEQLPITINAKSGAVVVCVVVKKDVDTDVDVITEAATKAAKAVKELKE